MKAFWAAAVSLLVAQSASAADQPSPLRPEEAAVVAGWQTKSEEQVRGIVLQPIEEVGGCLKLAGNELLLSDHQTLNSAVIQNVYRLKPGRYALVGVQWAAPYFAEYDWGGLSRDAGDLWIVTLAPGVVTDLGVWTITSPYAHRYILGEANLSSGLAAAQKAADGFGPLAMATWSRAPVKRSNVPCRS